MRDGSIRVLVTAFAPVPGSSPHAAALIGMAKSLRGDIDLITIKTDQLAHLDRIGDARMLRVPVGVGTAAEQREAFNRAIRRQLEAEPYDVVHARGPSEGVVVAEQHRSLGFRFVYEVATWPDEGEAALAEEHWARDHERCLEGADLILVPTEAAARALAERGHAGKVAVVHPGVDVNTFDWWPGARDETVRLLYLGTFASDRDLHTLLNAIRRVARRGPVEALLAGDPDPDRRARLRRIVRSFDLRSVVAVRGEPRAIALPTLISAADVCVAPAAATPRFQDFGDVPEPLLEYLACRRAVVAAGVPGIAEILRDEKEGLLYPPGDEHTLADAITTLQHEDTLRRRLVESGYDRVRWQFSDGARRRRIAEVYEMLMPGSQRFDAWTEGFGQEVTGVVSVPTQLFELEEEQTSPPPAPDTGEGVLAPEEMVDERSTPAYPLPGPDDTSPGIYAPAEEVAELPGQPTRIEAQEVVTDEQTSPGEPEPDTSPHRPEPDTGRASAPDHDTQH